MKTAVEYLLSLVMLPFIFVSLLIVLVLISSDKLID
jgi:hypothetical protein